MTKRLNWNTVAVLSMLAVCGVAARPSMAADTPGPKLPEIGGPTAITVGAYFPSGSRASDNGGSTQLAVDFRYLLPVRSPLTVPSRTVLTLGVEAGTKSGNHSTIVPLTVSEVIGANGGAPTASASPYFGIGLGAYFLNTSGLSTATRVGGFVQAGYNFTSTTFVDAKYQFVQDGDGFILSGGYRF